MVLLLFIFGSEFASFCQDTGSAFKCGIRANINMATVTGDESGMELGLSVGPGIKYIKTKNSSILIEVLYSTGGESSSSIIENPNVNVKIYNKLHLNYIRIPLIYQYYFTDILGFEIGPQFGFCLGGKTKVRTGNEDWIPRKLSSNDYNIFDFGLVTGIYTNHLTSENDFIVSLRAYFGFTDVMKNVGSNKNICIQLGIAYIIGK